MEGQLTFGSLTGLSRWLGETASPTPFSISFQPVETFFSSNPASTTSLLLELEVLYFHNIASGNTRESQVKFDYNLPSP